MQFDKTNPRSYEKRALGFIIDSTMSSILENTDLANDLKRAGILKKFSGNELIFSEGDDALFLPIVIEGSVKMVRFPEPGKEVIISVFGSGEMFAVPPVFDGEPYPATVIAMEDTELLLLRREDFLKMLRESPDLSFAVIGWMCGMLREKTAVIKNLATASPEHRVGNVLLRLVDKHTADDEKPMKIALRRQDIAEMAGLTTETTIRATRKLAERKLIRIVRGKIILDSTEDLENFLDS